MLIREQLDRLLACEWMIRWDGEDQQGTKEFGIKEIKLTNEYVGSDSKSGAFMREIILTEGFFEHLRRHAVPLNENAIRQLWDSATALDFYTWLAYRLPRINQKRPATLSWHQLAAHFGNEGNNIRKFRQTVQDAWDRQVSGVYPEARADFDTTVIRLHASPAPPQRTKITVLRLAAPPATTDAEGTQPLSDDPAALFLTAFSGRLSKIEAESWLSDATLEMREGEWTLLVGTAFKADWIRGHFGPAMEWAANQAKLGQVPYVAARVKA